MPNDMPRLYRMDHYFELHTRVWRPGIGFNAADQYGTVVAHNLFGNAVVDWEH